MSKNCSVLPGYYGVFVTLERLNQKYISKQRYFSRNNTKPHSLQFIKPYSIGSLISCAKATH